MCADVASSCIWHIYTALDMGGGPSSGERDLNWDASVTSQCSLTSSPASIGWLRPRWTVSRTRTLAALAPTCSPCFCSHRGNKMIYGFAVSLFSLFLRKPWLASLAPLQGPRRCARAARHQSRDVHPLPADRAYALFLRKGTSGS